MLQHQQYMANNITYMEKFHQAKAVFLNKQRALSTVHNVRCRTAPMFYLVMQVHNMKRWEMLTVTILHSHTYDYMTESAATPQSCSYDTVNISACIASNISELVKENGFRRKRTQKFRQDCQYPSQDPKWTYTEHVPTQG